MSNLYANIRFVLHYRNIDYYYIVTNLYTIEMNIVDVVFYCT